LPASPVCVEQCKITMLHAPKRSRRPVVGSTRFIAAAMELARQSVDADAPLLAGVSYAYKGPFFGKICKSDAIWVITIAAQIPLAICLDKGKITRPRMS